MRKSSLPDYESPTLPARPADVDALPETEWRAYRKRLEYILLCSACSDADRRQALQWMLEADRRLWPNRLANNLPFCGSVRAA